jgi:hypothetical protein
MQGGWCSIPGMRKILLFDITSSPTVEPNSYPILRKTAGKLLLPVKDLGRKTDRLLHLECVFYLHISYKFLPLFNGY